MHGVTPAVGAPSIRQSALHGHLSLARVSNSPTVISNVLAGAALAGALHPSATLVAVAIAMFLFYTAGMYLNDICDFDSDSRLRPDRPLVRGTVTRSSAVAVTGVFFVMGSALLWLAGTAAFVSGLVLIVLIVFYDVWHKGNPLSPVVMAGCRMMVYVTTFLAFASSPSVPLAIACGLMLAYLIGLTYLSKKEDSPSLARYWPAALLLLPALVLPLQGDLLVMLPLAGLFAAWTVYSISFIYRRTGRNVGGAIGRLLAGISLLDGLVMAAAGAAGGVAFALAAFGATHFLQRYIKGT